MIRRENEGGGIHCGVTCKHENVGKRKHEGLGWLNCWNRKEVGHKKISLSSFIQGPSFLVKLMVVRW